MAVYLITRDGAPKGEKPRMVEARTKTAAIAYAARSAFGAEPLSLKEAIQWTKEGVDLEEAKGGDDDLSEAEREAHKDADDCGE